MGIVAKNKVSVIFQIILALIPIADIFGWLRIKKLRYAILLIYIPAVATGILMVEFVPVPYYIVDAVIISLFDGGSYEITSSEIRDAAPAVILEIILSIAFIVWAVFLMYRWSVSWNRDYGFIS